MVISNPSCQERNDFFTKLNSIIPVHSAGKHMKNYQSDLVDSSIHSSENLIKFMSEYKFVIAFENSQVDGYTTEKLAQPLRCFSIPIYWGNKHVKDLIPGSCYLHDEPDQLLNQVLHLHENDEAYMNIVEDVMFPDGITWGVDRKRIEKELMKSLT
jgi:hypothetical protein